ncbi:MAG: hypothetical protein ACFFAO_02955 [Candidatus Hermodarchaeota archaeon]
MSKYIDKYDFEEPPKELKYFDGEPLKLNNDFGFYHNKNKFRKNLNDLQYLFKEKVNFALLAPGIRDTYLKEEYSETSLIVIFTDTKTIRRANEIFEGCNRSIEQNCFYIKCSSEYIILFAKKMDSLKKGIDTMYNILKQTLEDYFEQKIFDDYIKIRPFEIYDCV